MTHEHDGESLIFGPRTVPGLFTTNEAHLLALGELRPLTVGGVVVGTRRATDTERPRAILALARAARWLSGLDGAAARGWVALTGARR